LSNNTLVENRVKKKVKKLKCVFFVLLLAHKKGQLMKTDKLTYGIIILITTILTGCSHTPGGYSSYNYNSQNQTANRIAKQIPKYQSLQNQAWPIIYSETTIKPNDKHPSVKDIRERLIILGDLNAGLFSKGNQYDYRMEQAVRHFQWRHGIKQTGHIDKNTLQALNMSPQEKTDLLITSMYKWSQFNDIKNPEYILVNIPAYQLHVMKNGREQLKMKVITGTVANQTPELNSNITTIVFNPTWNVPESIITNEIAGFMKNDPEYLKKNNISIYKTWNNQTTKINPEDIDWTDIENNGTNLRFTQSSGNHNVLGKVKFLFYNPHDVYLHDTQNKSLFNTTKRTYSHGCVRVENPLMLAQYLLDNNRKSELDAVYETSTLTKTKYVNLSRKMPIHITYIVAWVDEYGITHFRKNIYNKPLTYRSS